MPGGRAEEGVTGTTGGVGRVIARINSIRSVCRITKHHQAPVCSQGLVAGVEELTFILFAVHFGWGLGETLSQFLCRSVSSIA